MAEYQIQATIDRNSTPKVVLKVTNISGDRYPNTPYAIYKPNGGTPSAQDATIISDNVYQFIISYNADALILWEGISALTLRYHQTSSNAYLTVSGIYFNDVSCTMGRNSGSISNGDIIYIDYFKILPVTFDNANAPLLQAGMVNYDVSATTIPVTGTAPNPEITINYTNTAEPVITTP